MNDYGEPFAQKANSELSLYSRIRDAPLPCAMPELPLFFEVTNHLLFSFRIKCMKVFLCVVPNLFFCHENVISIISRLLQFDRTPRLAFLMGEDRTEVLLPSRIEQHEVLLFGSI